MSLLIHNVDARRAGLLTGALPWLGIVAGAWMGVKLSGEMTAVIAPASATR